MAESLLITQCHQSILLVAVGTTGRTSWPPGATSSREGIGKDRVGWGTASALAWLGWAG